MPTSSSFTNQLLKTLQRESSLQSSPSNLRLMTSINFSECTFPNFLKSITKKEQLSNIHLNLMTHSDFTWTLRMVSKSRMLDSKSQSLLKSLVDSRITRKHFLSQFTLTSIQLTSIFRTSSSSLTSPQWPSKRHIFSTLTLANFQETTGTNSSRDSSTWSLLKSMLLPDNMILRNLTHRSKWLLDKSLTLLSAPSFTMVSYTVD